MRYKQLKQGYLIRIMKDEELITELTNFCKEKFISGASLTGIGGVSKCEIAYFSMETTQYSAKVFNEQLELLNITGNITLVNKQPFVHAHVVLGDKNMKTYGGHLKSAVVCPTAEIILTEFVDETVDEANGKDSKLKIERKKDEKSGLNLMEL